MAKKEVEKKVTKKAVAEKVVKQAKPKKATAPKVEKKVKEVKEVAPAVVAKAPKAVQTPQQEESEKQDVIKLFATQANDTGSPEVQVAILTWKIVRLQKHLAENPKDNHSRRGLLKIISKRRRIMNYLKKKDEKRYRVLETKIQEYQKARG